MAKWYGVIGFVDTAKVEKGIYEPSIVERNYYGDVLSNHWKRQNSDKMNDDINLSNQISILADPYAVQHCSLMAYVEYMGTKWTITDVEVKFPRLLLNVGGVFNG